MSRSPRTAVAKTATRPSAPSYAELEARIAALTAELREAREQQTATGGVLQVINSSPGDLTLVFDAILEKALRLCEATHGHIWRIEGEYGHAVALRGDAQFIESMRGESPTDLRSGRPLTRIARGECVVHIPDATKEELYRTHHAYREFIDASGIRSGVMVALRSDEALLGAIVVHRKEVLPFTDKEIALLQNFAAQAVIAMENARLLTETRELLERQTATSEILSVISRSPTDVQPVFEAIVARAARVCDAEFSAVARFADGLLHLVALNNMSPKETAAFHSLFPRPPGRHFVMGRAFVDAQPVHFDDVLTWLDYDPHTVKVLQSVSGYRSFVAYRSSERVDRLA